jgi:hypothetical protein
MKKTGFLILIGTLLVGLTFSSYGQKTPATATKGNQQTNSAPALTQKEMIARGKYIVNTTGCHDCHSPKVMGPQGPEPDMSRALSGHPSNVPLPPINKEALKNWVLFNQDLTAFVGPWGVSYAANLTSDATGTGNWTEKQFLTAIRKGKYKGLENNRSLLPPMPWQVFAQMTDYDLKSIFAYLKTTKPVRNVVPAPQPPNMITRAKMPPPAK